MHNKKHKLDRFKRSLDRLENKYARLYANTRHTDIIPDQEGELLIKIHDLKRTIQVLERMDEYER